MLLVLSIEFSDGVFRVLGLVFCAKMLEDVVDDSQEVFFGEVDADFFIEDLTHIFYEIQLLG